MEKRELTTSFGPNGNPIFFTSTVIHLEPPTRGPIPHPHPTTPADPIVITPTEPPPQTDPTPQPPPEPSHTSTASLTPSSPSPSSVTPSVTASDSSTTSPPSNSTTTFSTTSPPSVLPLSNSTSSTTSRSLPVPSPSKSASSPPPPASSRVPIGVIVGAVVAGVVFLGVALFVFIRRRRLRQLLTPEHRIHRQGSSEPFISSRGDTLGKSAESGSLVTPAILIEKDGQAHSGPSSEPVTSSATAPSMRVSGDSREPASFGLAESDPGRRGRREVDAGPVPTNREEDNDEEDTLPPDYRDVFSLARSSAANSSRGR